VSEWSNMFTCGLLCQWVSSINISSLACQSRVYEKHHNLFKSKLVVDVVLPNKKINKKLFAILTKHLHITFSWIKQCSVFSITLSHYMYCLKCYQITGGGIHNSFCKWNYQMSLIKIIVTSDYIMKTI